MKGKDLIKKIKELGSEGMGKEIVFSKDYMNIFIREVKIENDKIVLK